MHALTDYIRTPEDDANDAAERAWKERRRKADRRVIIARVEQERRAAVRRCVDAYAARIGSAK